MKIEEEIEEYNRRVYGGEMPAHNKSVLRSVIEKENKFWDEEPFREDSNNTPVEGI